MTTKTLPIGAKITKVSVWYHSAAFLTGDTAPRISWNNGSSWSSYDNTPDFDNRTGGPLNNTGYVRTDFTGLDKGQSDLDLFAIGLVAQLVDPPPPMTGIIVNTLWAEIFYEVEALDVEVNMTVNDEDLYEVEALQYSHKTNVSAIVDLDIWDWKADQWDEIESIDNTATFNDRYVALGNSSDYLNSTNGVRVRYQSLGAAQLELDSMNLLYSTILVPDNLYLSPIQPDNFTMAKGSLETPYGELATINGNYTIVKSEAVGSGGQWTSSVSPDWDYETQWNDGASTPHWDKVDEDPDNPDGNNVQEAYTSNLYDRYGFEDVSVEGGEVTQVKLRILFFRIGTGTPQVNLYFDGAYQGWKNLISNPVTPQEYTWTGLSGDQTDVDNMQVRFRSSCMGTGPKTNTIYALEALVYYQTPRYDVDFQIDLQIDDEYCYFPNSISYSFKTNVSATIDFDIWDWTTETWYEIESVNNYATFDYDLFVLDMGSNYVNSTNGIRIRFQCLDNENDFQLEIDQLRLDYYYVEP